MRGWLFSLDFKFSLEAIRNDDISIASAQIHQILSDSSQEEILCAAVDTRTSKHRG